MNLPGRLRLTTLGDLLGVLHRARASGVLELVEAEGAATGRAHRIHLCEGLVDDVETALLHAPLGEVLSSDGLLAREALSELVRRLIECPGKRAGDILIDERLADSETVVRGLESQLRRRLEALFALRDASVRFHVRGRPRAERRRPRPLSPTDFLQGRPRARRRPHGTNDATSAVERAAYRALGLVPGQNITAVRRAFRQLAAAVHPDRHPHASPERRAELLRRFAELSAAYHMLAR